LARLAIWERALHKTFEEKELNQDFLKQVTATRDRVKQLQAQKSANEIQDLASYQAWLQELNQTIAQLGRLETLAYGVARDGKMPIAVNGFVNAGGKFLAASDTNLKAALQEAGGISKIGSPTRVSVYRGARKTTYNLLSKEYTPVPLKPGDLIVVEQARPSYDDSEDFFAAELFPSIDYRNEPAVVIPSRSPNYEPSDDSIDGFAAADPFAAAGGSGDSSPASLFNIARMENPEGLDFNALKDTLAKAPDPWAVYRQLRPESHYPDSFYLQWGDLLLDSKKPKLAHRVLSNLIETPGPRPTAYRKWAYLLAKHQDWAGALDLLDRAARQAPNDLAIVLDQAWLLEQQGNEQAAAAKRKELVENLDPTDPPAIKIAEIANAEIPSTDEKDRLPLDLRIVVSCASGQSLDLSMGEPSDTMTHFDEWPGGSKIGARTLEAVGVAEYTLRQAVPGPYRLSYRSPFPQLVRLQLYRNWGRDHQTCEEMIILLPASQTRRPLASFRLDLN
jgi:tetratricopeptide (TPR) repeat protein